MKLTWKIAELSHSLSRS